MKPSSLQAFGLAAISGLAQVLVFPRFSIYHLAAVALTPLLYALWRADSAKQRFLLGWLAGAIYWGGTCYWVFGVMNDYAGLAAPAAAAIFIGFFLAKGLHLAMFGVLAGPLLRKPWALPAVAALWVALEGTHQYLGFTWLPLGAAAAGMTVLAPLMPWTGVYGPSFVLAAFNVALFLVWARRPRRELAGLLLLPLLLLLPSLPENEVGDHMARLVQPNVHPDQVINGWDARRATEHMRRMLELSTVEADRQDPTPPELLVWPEYTVPAYYFDSEPSRQYLEAIARTSGAYFIFNTLAFETVEGQRRPLNSAVMLDREGRMLSHYSKRFLVPFGEFVPWPFSTFIDKITLAAGDFLPGRDVALAQIGEHRVGTYICYETAFARGVRDFTKAGAEVLVNISNDSWYGATSARYQHLLLTRVRAIENQRWILRATSDGITTIVNRAGQIVPPLPSFEEGVLCARFSYSGELSWFVRFGEWFWYLCMALSVIFAALARR